jgi:CubicO group peptidase (beta-lactamase class C family)
MIKYKKLTMKNHFAIISAVLSALYFNNPCSAQLPMDSIKYIVKTGAENKKSKGIVAGIIDQNGMQVYGYGKMDDNTHLQPNENTLFEIGSITKVFTTLILADMVQKKELNLEDPISKFLPKTVKTPVRNGKEITLKDLATHTSGLPNDEMTLRAGPFDTQKMYKALSSWQLKRDIGSQYEYCSFGIGLLGHILCLKAGVDFETLVKDRICKPLGMEKTFLNVPPEWRATLATGYTQAHSPAAPISLEALCAAGQLKSNVNDMLKFLSAQIGLTKSTLSPAIEIMQEVRDSMGQPYMFVGLGWHVIKRGGTEIYMHSGGTEGYRSFITFDKKLQRGVIILSNSAIMVDDIAFQLLDSKHKLKPIYYPMFLKDTMNTMITTKGAEAAENLYYQLKNAKDPRYTFDEDQLNILGYELYQAKKIKEAIAILTLNISEYPESWNTFDSLGEVYASNGDTALAIANYERSVKLNPDHKAGLEMLKKLKNK